MTGRGLMTRRGWVHFPAYLPVTTFGDKYPLDRLLQPYLARLAGAVMVAYHYARQMTPDRRPTLPLWVDSTSPSLSTSRLTRWSAMNSKRSMRRASQRGSPVAST